MSVDQSGLKIVSQPSLRARHAPLIEGFKLHPVGLEIEEWVDQRTWYEFGKVLQQTDYAWEWIVADWLAFGHHKYGDKVYGQAARIFGKAARTWEDYAYIARNVKFSERSEILPVLLHKPVARFSSDPELQRRLLALAEQYGLSKVLFERVIALYIDGKPYQHVLPSELTPIVRARVRAEKERDRVRRKVLSENGGEWLEYAYEQAERWRQMLDELERCAHASNASMRLSSARSHG